MHFEWRRSAVNQVLKKWEQSNGVEQRKESSCMSWLVANQDLWENSIASYPYHTWLWGSPLRKSPLAGIRSYTVDWGAEFPHAFLLPSFWVCRGLEQAYGPRDEPVTSSSYCLSPTKTKTPTLREGFPSSWITLLWSLSSMWKWWWW